MLRMLDCQQDIPPRQRIEWVEGAMHLATNPKDSAILRQAIKRLKHSRHRAKHPVFYSITPLMHMAFPTTPPLPTWDLAYLLDTLLLQLRLTTLMRSVDAANITWALFTQDHRFYILATDKKGEAITFNVQGLTLHTPMEYLTRHLDHPGLFLFRYLSDPNQCLGAERLAKRLLGRMQAAGIHTQVFKAHSLRGATATHLLANGAPQTLVQARGHWTTQGTLDMYYSRLHQQVDWQAHLMGGHASERQEAACAVLSPSAPQADPTKEGESGGDGGESTAQVAALRAHGVLRPLYDTTKCPSCNLTMQKEAAYRCRRCGSMSHVRCMRSRRGKHSTSCCLPCAAAPHWPFASGTTRALKAPKYQEPNEAQEVTSGLIERKSCVLLNHQGRAFRPISHPTGGTPPVEAVIRRTAKLCTVKRPAGTFKVQNIAICRIQVHCRRPSWKRYKS